MAKIYGIGLGPGDAELITVKGLNMLRHCPTIAYPAPPDKPSFVRQIASRWLDEMPPKKEIIIPIPLTPDSGTDDTAYRQGADKIMLSVNDGDDVAILCEGDPFLYGSFIYLFEKLSLKIAAANPAASSSHSIEIIPGISSVMAAAARISRPLAEKSEPLLILPALKIDDNLRDKLEQFPTLAIMKIGKRFGALKQLLTELGLLENAFYIEYATLHQEKILPLKAADFTQAPYFSMVLIRKNKKIIP